MLLVAPSIFLIIAYFSTFGLEGQNYANKIRAEEIRNFYDSLILDLKRSLKISTLRAILHATQEVIRTGEPFTNSEERISIMIFNGTLDGEEVPSLIGLTGYPCNTIVCWNKTYIMIARTSNYDLSIEKISIEVRPYDSWSLNSSVTIKIKLRDKYTDITIIRTTTESVIVPITGFEDPLYILCTKGKLTRLIDKQTYQESDEGPSFLDRLEGRLTLSDEFRSQSAQTIGLSSYIDSLRDYEYFRNSC
jgi:hypothetical protein